ncbi:MAG TPA: hypothetical protein VFE62_07920 [Gemmataceae bacterium]|nr:hypothetical protein [Gemmataceae bacterium]
MTPVQFTLELTTEERDLLLNWLEQRKREKLVEEHRTDSGTYRTVVLQQEAILDGLIQKLQR